MNCPRYFASKSGMQAHQLYHRYLERKMKRRKVCFIFAFWQIQNILLNYVPDVLFKTIEPLHCCNLDHDYAHINVNAAEFSMHTVISYQDGTKMFDLH